MPQQNRNSKPQLLKQGSLEVGDEYNGSGLRLQNQLYSDRLERMSRSHSNNFNLLQANNPQQSSIMYLGQQRLLRNQSINENGMVKQVSMLFNDPNRAQTANMHNQIITREISQQPMSRLASVQSYRQQTIRDEKS